MRDLRNAFLTGEEPPECDRCWNEERAGRTSKRQHTLNRLQNLLPDTEWTSAPGPLMFLDLKLGNICNLKCRICGSWSSSTFAVEEIGYQSDKKNNFHYAMLQMGRWPREQTMFWTDLRRYFSGLKYLEFTGGEPFLIQEHFDLLRDLVDSGDAAHVELHYNTNGTVFPVGAENLWSQFRHVEIAFSIDDVGARFEYQRSGADWIEVQGHIELFREMRQRCQNISLQCCSTVSIFNVLYLADLANWIRAQEFDYVHWNLLHDPDDFSIRTLPGDAKQFVTDSLRGQHFSAVDLEEIEKILAFMHQGPVRDGREMLRRIRELDQRRNQRLDLVAPELARLIGYEKTTA